MTKEEVQQEAENYSKDVEDLGDGDGVHSITQIQDSWIAGYKAAQEEYELDAERWKTFIAITDKKNK